MKKLLLSLLLLSGTAYADTKISAMTSTTTLNAQDVIPIVANPTGTATNNIITKTNLATTLDILTQSSATATYFQNTALIPIANGGTHTASTLTGVVRGGSAYTASELSGDVTTSGSNATTAAATQPNIKTFTSSVTVTNTGGASFVGPIAASSATFSSSIAVSSNVVLPGTTFYQNGNITLGTASSAIHLPQSAPNNVLQVDSNGNLIGAAVSLSAQVTSILQTASFPALTGDITTPSGSIATTAAANQSHIKTFTSSITVNDTAGLKVNTVVSMGSFTATAANLTTTSMTVTGSDGLATTYGLSVGSMTGAGLTTCGDATHALAWNSATNLFTCQSVTGSGGGGGSSTLAVTTGTAAGWTGVPTSSPTAVINASSTTFSVLLKGGATAYWTMLAHTGDVTSPADSLVMTAAATQANIKTFTSSITVTNTAGLSLTGPITGSSATLSTVGTTSSDVPTLASTSTLTNKRMTKRGVTAADATSITPNTDNADWTYQLNTQSVGTLTINADAGTPTNLQPWGLKIKSTNVQTFSWNAGYVGGTVALPTATTGSGKIDYYTFIYDTVNSKWAFTGQGVGF